MIKKINDKWQVIDNQLTNFWRHMGKHKWQARIVFTVLSGFIGAIIFLITLIIIEKI